MDQSLPPYFSLHSHGLEQQRPPSGVEQHSRDWNKVVGPISYCVLYASLVLTFTIPIKRAEANRTKIVKREEVIILCLRMMLRAPSKIALNLR